MKNSLRQVGGAPYSLFVDGLSKGCRGEEAIGVAEVVSPSRASQAGAPLLPCAVQIDTPSEVRMDAALVTSEVLPFQRDPWVQ